MAECKFNKVLVANRGEIAIRVFRACYDLGLHTVAMYSNEDTFSLFRTKADEAYLIGENKSPLGAYLDIPSIIDLAKRRNVDAIHPGYGFLSENDQFADACAEAGIAFIGPSGDVIRAMGNKAAARRLMQQAGVPVVPGSDGAVATAEEAKALADSIGYPVLIKASAGGGGRGMRRVFEPDQLIPLFEEARSESVACFGSGEMYLEKLILNPKHIEFQIMADKMGHVIQLGERDCSIQRRNQKMLEESPSRALTPELREKMGAAAVAAAKAAHYENAGTIEFVLDPDGNFYFIEMNTRIQVEHPVTEFVTGMDLVREQIRIAAGLAILLSFSPKFAALVSAMPTATMGGVSMVLYGMISAVGVRNIVENQVDFTNSRNVIIAAIIMVLAIGVNYSGAVTFSVGSIEVSLSGLAVAAIAGIALNAVLPGKDYEFGEDEKGDTSVNFQV